MHWLFFFLDQSGISTIKPTLLNPLLLFFLVGSEVTSKAEPKPVLSSAINPFLFFFLDADDIGAEEPEVIIPSVMNPLLLFYFSG